MSKAASRYKEFSERRANLSTRMSSRGHGFEASIEEDLQRSIVDQIPSWIVVLKAAEASAARGNEDAARQVNAIRGRLCSWRRLLSDPRSFSTAALFMTVARELLPFEFFDALLAETRAIREGVAATLISDINEACGDAPPQGTVTFRTQKSANRRRRNRHGRHVEQRDLESAPAPAPEGGGK